ncbi:hypothetical protein B0H10DRAFT_2164536 [Mycena sp. CBHHK59/15]|nr:hypothetical protein B0H10DRAFT_2164536 [Mycena sp. CBHHK59/15]
MHFTCLKPSEPDLEILDAAYERGCTFWDTADIYKQRGADRQFGYYMKDNHTINGDPEYVKLATENCLKKLGMSSNTSAFRGLCGNHRHAHAVHPIAAMEVEYCPQIGVLSVCRELESRFILTGQVLLSRNPLPLPEGDFRKMFPKYNDENFPNILRLADGLKEIGKHQGPLAARCAGDIIPIPGTKKVCASITHYNRFKLHFSIRSNYIENSNATKGDRYPSWGMGLAYANTPGLKA